MRKFRLLGCAYALSLLSCTGSIEDPLSLSGGGTASRGDPSLPSAAASNGPAAGGGGLFSAALPPVGLPTAPSLPGQSSAPLTCTKRSVGPAPFRRLTKVQYTRTVEDLLSLTPDVSGFPADDSTHGFDVGLQVSSLLVESYGDAAETLAARVDLKKVLPCDPALGEEACAKQFIERFSRRAFRRATSEDERARLFAIYGVGRSNATFERGARLVIEAVLQSPSFVYHVEQSDGVDADGLRKLSSYALANRLSYLLWGSLPDVALLDAAAAGKLATEEGLESEARRMLSARADAGRRGFREFYRQWLSLHELETMERDATRYPEFNRALATQLGDSLSRQIDATVWDDAGDVEALLLGQSAFVNASVAPLFGLSAVGATFNEVALDAAQRRGILTHPALLSVLSKPNQSDPVIRGKFVRERLLCQPLPPPPPNVATVPPDPKPGLTTRQRFSEHSTNASCTGCHKLMDPIGFGLEHFDALGRYRATEEGVAIDARGEILSSVDANGTFDGAVQLSERLADSKAVRDCVATQYFRFALARTETNADGCSLAKTFERFEQQGGALKELIIAVVKSDAFRYLTPEVMP
jgi:hypothetical protein